MTKPTLGGRATLQAVTRVKLERASKVKLWTPTRLRNGEGRVGQVRNRQVHLFWSTGVVSTACKGGGLGNWRGLGAGRGRASNADGRPGGQTGSRRGSDYR